MYAGKDVIRAYLAKVIIDAVGEQFNTSRPLL
jgi:hypothetical protein